MTAVSLLRGLVADPIVAREGRARTRSPATAVAITISIAAVAAAAAAMFSLAVADAPDQSPDGAQMATVAYHAMALQVALVVLLGPSLAAGAITAERERGTLEPLLVGELTPGAVVRAKLIASVSYVLLFVAAVFPLYFAVFRHAGVGLGGLLLAELVTFTSAVAAVSLGILMSAVCSRTSIATLAATGLGLALCLDVVLSGTVPAPGAGLGRTARPPLATTYLETVHPVRMANPLYSVHQLVRRPGAAVSVGHLIRSLVPGGTGAGRGWGPSVKPWQVTVLVQLALSALMLPLAVRFVPPETPPRRRRRDHAR